MYNIRLLYVSITLAGIQEAESRTGQKEHETATILRQFYGSRRIDHLSYKPQIQLFTISNLTYTKIPD